MAGAVKLAAISALALLGAFVGMTAASAGGGGHCEVNEGSGTRVELSGACFTPTTLFAQPGETISFVNRDPVAHNVSGSDWGHPEDMREGDRFATSFADEGVYAYSCTLHPGMTGSIVIGEGDSTTAVMDAEPGAPSAAPSLDLKNVFLVGAAGLLIGAVGGATVVTVRRRPTER